MPLVSPSATPAGASGNIFSSFIISISIYFSHLARAHLTNV